MTSILGKNALTVDRSLNSLEPNKVLYYNNHLFWLFENHVTSRCQGFPARLLLDGEKP